MNHCWSQVNVPTSSGEVALTCDYESSKRELEDHIHGCTLLPAKGASFRVTWEINKEAKK